MIRFVGELMAKIEIRLNDIFIMNIETFDLRYWLCDLQLIREIFHWHRTSEPLLMLAISYQIDHQCHYNKLHCWDVNFQLRISTIWAVGQ